MKRVCKWIFPFSFFLFLLVSVPTITRADPGGPGCNPDDPLCPIDGGVTALLAIGVGYGIKKYKDTRKSSANLQEPVSK